jgi:hypothetical protein
VRATDGLTVCDRSNAFGEAELEIPAGRYTLVVGGELGRNRQVRREITIKKDADGPLRFELQRHPVLRVDAAALSPDWSVVLASEWDMVDVTEEAREGAIPAPEGLELVLRIQTGRTSCAALVPVPREGRGGERPALVLTGPDRPERARSPIPEPRPVTVLFPDGTPAAGATVHCRGVRSFQFAYADERGRALAGFPGCHVEIDAGEAWIPLRARLAGEGPWTLRFGSCALELEVTGGDGAPLERFVFVVDGALFSSRSGGSVRGLRPGAHRILVAAGGWLAKDCRVVLKADETRRLALRLSAP